MTSTTRQIRFASLHLGTLVLLCLGGCAQMDLTSMHFPWQSDDDAAAIPEKIVVFWSDTILHQGGKRPVRGFGGRVFFYGKDLAKSIKVDGTITVFAFDADNQDPANQRPQRKFVFPAENMAQHLSHSKLGPSYSVWVPWDEVGGPTRNISLIVRLESPDTGVVVSDPVNKILPGVDTKNHVRVQRGSHSTGQPVRQATYETPAGSSTRGAADLPHTPRAMTTDSIDLPPSFLQRLRQSERYERSTPPANTNATGYLVPTTSSGQASLPGTTSATSGVPRSSVPHSNPSGTAGAMGAPSGPPSRPLASDPRTGSRSRGVADSPATRSGLSRYRAQTPRAASLIDDPIRRGPHPAGWLSGLPPTPRFGWRRTTAGTRPARQPPVAQPPNG